nr:subtilisin-like protein [Trichoderma cf. fertile]
MEVTIREDAGEMLPLLLSLLRTGDQLVEDLVPNDADATDQYGNSKSNKHPKSQIEMAAFKGSVSIRSLTENLHRTLQQHWLCQIDSHDHDGTLRECVKAELQLEPQ